MFSGVNLPVLADGLGPDTASLHTDGSTAAVPEPTT